MSLTQGEVLWQPSEAVINPEAMANPESLAFFVHLAAQRAAAALETKPAQ